MIPTAAELDAWLETLRQGYATKEMLPRVIDAYKRLLKVAETAQQWVDTEELWRNGAIPGELMDALDALEAPMPETEGK